MRTFRDAIVTRAHVMAAVRLWAPRGIRSVHFTGGEPTLHPDLPAIAERVAGLGLRVSVGSNGWKLANQRYAQRLVPHLADAMISLHGATPQEHDRIVRRSGSFQRAILAIERLVEIAGEQRAPGFPGVNVVVTRLNVDDVPDTVNRAIEAGARFILISNLSPEGEGLRNYADLAIPLSRAPALADSIVQRAGGRAIVRFFGFPACVLGSSRTLSNDLFHSPRVTVEWANVAASARLVSIVSLKPDRGRTHAPACARCTWANLCAGPFTQYDQTFGQTDFPPFAQRLS